MEKDIKTAYTLQILLSEHEDGSHTYTGDDDLDDHVIKKMAIEDKKKEQSQDQSDDSGDYELEST